MTASRAFADVLRWVPLFADLDPELRAEVAGRAAPVRVEAGQWLFQEGEPADSLYVVLMTAFDQLARLREAGRRSARPALEQVPALVAPGSSEAGPARGAA